MQNYWTYQVVLEKPSCVCVLPAAVWNGVSDQKAADRRPRWDPAVVARSKVLTVIALVNINS